MLESSGSPASEKRAVADLGDGLEREDFEAAEEERFVAPSKRRVGDETGAVDVGIDDGGASGCPPVNSGRRRGRPRPPPW